MTNETSQSNPANQSNQATEETPERASTEIPEGAVQDPRPALKTVLDAVADLMASTETRSAETLAGETPCPGFAVTDLLDHLVMVVRRIAVVGAGGDFATVQQDVLESGWAEAFRSGADEVGAVWSDSAKLEAMLRVPWGEMPGAPILLAYIGELVTHGWDLATATGQRFGVADELLEAALMAVQFVPAEGRESDEVPFGPVVDPGPDATTVERIAGWLGRDVA